MVYASSLANLMDYVSSYFYSRSFSQYLSLGA